MPDLPPCNIDPAKVTGYVGIKYPRPISPKAHLPWPARVIETLVYLRHSRLFNLRWDLRAVPIDRHPKFLKVKDLVENLDRYRESAWYQSCLAEIRGQGFALHKKIRMVNQEQLDHFFETYACDLVRSMRVDGYLPGKGVTLVGVAIGRHGEIIKTNAGDHRFFAARAIGVKPIPVMVKYFHPKWLQANRLSLQERDGARLRQALEDVARACQ